jgi:hypothetical protein
MVNRAPERERAPTRRLVITRARSPAKVLLREIYKSKFLKKRKELSYIFNFNSQFLQFKQFLIRLFSYPPSGTVAVDFPLLRQFNA